MRKTSGLSLLLLIFLSLCLITFSLLSVSEASADRNLSRKSADRTTEYYAAVTAANERLADIDALLAEYLRQAEAAENPSKTYLALCGHLSEELPGLTWKQTFNCGTADARATKSNADESVITETQTYGSRMTGAQISASGTVSFTVPVTDGQILLADLLIAWPESEDDPLYQITSWKIVNTKDWHPDTSQHLYLDGRTD